MPTPNMGRYPGTNSCTMPLRECISMLTVMRA